MPTYVGALSLGSPGWLWPSLMALLATLLALLWAYRRARASLGVRTTGGLLKAAGILVLLLILTFQTIQIIK